MGDAVSDYEIPEELRYSAEDEWVRLEGNRATLGISDYAQQQLGDVVFVELPKPGRRVAVGESFGVIESVKAVSELYAPVAGEVVETNATLEDRPEAVNESCYGEGWICVIAVEGEEALESLLDASAYTAHVQERSQ